MLKKFCRCGKIISQEFKMCSECQSKEEDRLKISNKNIYKKYKSNRTDFKEQKFYTSKDWKLTREVVKQRDKGLCKLCEDKSKINFADTVHHIEPLKDCWGKRFSSSNLICLCNRCHFYVHKKYDKSNDSKVEMQVKLQRIIKDE